MSRKLTAEEKNKVKNLQVSNSIYKKDIKKLVDELNVLNPQLADLKAKQPDLLGEEEAKVSQAITQLEATIGAKCGKIKYIEGRIAEKENKIEEIKTTALREEETVVEISDPNDPEVLAKREAEKEAKRKKQEAAKAARKAKRNKSEKPATPTTEEF
jgi:chromosome segregation ATPase